MPELVEPSLVITKLKEGYILCAFLSRKQTLFAMRNQRVFCQNASCCFSLSFQEFAEIYRDTAFYYYEDSAPDIDAGKDETYYRLGPLKK